MSNEQKHTQGLLRFDGPKIVSEFYPVATVNSYNTAEGKANGRRLVAAWNACIDVPTETLEAMATLPGLYGSQEQAVALVEQNKALLEFVENSERALDYLLQVLKEKHPHESFPHAESVLCKAKAFLSQPQIEAK